MDTSVAHDLLSYATSGNSGTELYLSSELLTTI